MKTYIIPFGGSLGKHESWDGEIVISISDRDAARMEASARRGDRFRLDEDTRISDVHDRIRKKVYREYKLSILDDSWFKELQEDNPEKAADEILDEEMGFWHVCYPEELQHLVEEEE